MPNPKRPDQERLEAIVNVTSIALAKLKAVRNSEGTIIDFEYEWLNGAAVKLSFDCTGKLMLEEFPATLDTGLFQLMVKTVETGDRAETDIHYNAEPYNLWLHYELVKLDDGLMFSCEDITQRRKDALELLHLKDTLAQQATNKYLTLFNNMEQAFCIIEILFDNKDNAVDYRFLETNPQFERQTQLHNAVGRTVREFQPHHEEFWFRTYGDVIKTGRSMHFEHEAAHITGRVWYEVFALPFDEPVKKQVAVFFNNITACKRLEYNQALLSEISRQLFEPSGSTTTLEALSKRIGEHFDVKWCTFTKRNSDDETCSIDGWNAADVSSLKGTHRLSDYLSPEQAERDNAGELTIINDTRTDPRTNTELYAPLGIWSFIVVPLARDGEWKFRLSIIDTKIREWREDEIALIQELAFRIWSGLSLAHNTTKI